MFGYELDLLNLLRLLLIGRTTKLEVDKTLERHTLLA